MPLAGHSNVLSVIGFDADDTLWQNEYFFRMTEEKFAALLSDYAESDHITESLLEAERRNETLPHARRTLMELCGRYRLILITKGDLFDQERKLAQSGLGELFDDVQIVSEKTTETYKRIFSNAGMAASTSMMVGNSLKSDVIPAIEAGSFGVHVPHDLTWVHEHADIPVDAPRYHSIEHLGELPDLIEKLR